MSTDVNTAPWSCVMQNLHNQELYSPDQKLETRTPALALCKQLGTPLPNLCTSLIQEAHLISTIPTLCIWLNKNRKSLLQIRFSPFDLKIKQEKWVLKFFEGIEQHFEH